MEIHAILTETLGKYAPSYVTVKNWVVQFKPGDFSNYFIPGGAKDFSAPGICVEVHTLMLKLKKAA
jgi:hypothetical protein